MAFAAEAAVAPSRRPWVPRVVGVAAAVFVVLAVMSLTSSAPPSPVQHRQIVSDGEVAPPRPLATDSATVAADVTSTTTSSAAAAAPTTTTTADPPAPSPLATTATPVPTPAAAATGGPANQTGPFVISAPAPNGETVDGVVHSGLYRQHEAASRRYVGMLRHYENVGKRQPAPNSTLPAHLTRNGGLFAGPYRAAAMRMLVVERGTAVVSTDAVSRIFVTVTEMHFVTQGLVAATFPLSTSSSSEAAAAAMATTLLDASSQYHSTMVVNGEILSPAHAQTAIDGAEAFVGHVTANASDIPEIDAAAHCPDWNSSACGAWPPPAFWWGVHAFDAFPSHGLEDWTNTIGRFAAWTNAVVASTTTTKRPKMDAAARRILSRLDALKRNMTLREALVWVRSCVPILVQQPRRQFYSPLNDTLRFVTDALPYLRLVRLPREAPVRQVTFALPKGSAIAVPMLQRPNEIPAPSARFVNQFIAPVYLRRRQDKVDHLIATATAFPQAVIILKTRTTQSASQYRGFNVTDAITEHISKTLGLTIVSDQTPKALRMRLINNAAVVVSTWGGAAAVLALMNAYMWRELPPSAVERAGLEVRPGPLRLVQLIHSGYEAERWQIACFAESWPANMTTPPFPNASNTAEGEDPRQPLVCEEENQHELQRYGVRPAFVRLPSDDLTLLTRKHVFG